MTFYLTFDNLKWTVYAQKCSQNQLVRSCSDKIIIIIIIIIEIIIIIFIQHNPISVINTVIKGGPVIKNI